MSQQPDPPHEQPRALPAWLLPAVIFGAIALVAGLVTVALTMRDLPSTTASITAEAQTLPTGHPTLDPAAAADATALPAAHGGLDPNGPTVELISLADARARLDAGMAVFVDVRTGSDYAAGHIPGALTITAQDLSERFAALPEGAAIIAYGDSARPESGQRGAQIFMELGYPTVIALDGSFQDWIKAGNPVEP